MQFNIGKRLIGKEEPPFIIAEMSGNHNNSLSRALEIVEAAAYAGVDAIKLQTYKASTMTLDIKGGDFEIGDKKSLWHGRNLFDLYEEACTPWEWHVDIFEHANKLGLICFSSPFDETAVDFLDELGVPAYKIASFENNHLPLIKYASSKGKPLIISTGMATISELDQAVSTARENGCKEIILLKCTSTYPATSKNTNLKTIPHLEKLFNCQTGLSDHTFGIGTAIAGVSLGATVIEKHFTLSRSDGGVDSAFSLEPDEMKQLVEESRTAWESLGEIKYGPTTSELESVKYKRSIYVSNNISKGEYFSKENLKIIRPGEGLQPYFWDIVIGRKSSRDLKKGTPLDLDLIE